MGADGPAASRAAGGPGSASRLAVDAAAAGAAREALPVARRAGPEEGGAVRPAEGGRRVCVLSDFAGW